MHPIPLRLQLRPFVLLETWGFRGNMEGFRALFAHVRNGKGENQSAVKQSLKCTGFLLRVDQTNLLQLQDVGYQYAYKFDFGYKADSVLRSVEFCMLKCTVSSSSVPFQIRGLPYHTHIFNFILHYNPHFIHNSFY